MLDECADHGTRVRGEEVLYMGWNAYGICVQSLPARGSPLSGGGAKRICRNPLAGLAVMEPLTPVVRSSITTLSPSAVSNMVVRILSPEFMNRSVAGFGVKVATFAVRGPAGPWPAVVPSLVTNAKLRYSTPPAIKFWQSVFSALPWIGSSDRLSMLSA